MVDLENKILSYLGKGKLDLKHLAAFCGVLDEFPFLDTLKLLEQKGKIFSADGVVYESAPEGYLYGKVHIAKNGTGYVNLGSKTYMIRPCDMNGALPKDTVLFKVSPKKYYGNQYGQVSKIVKRDCYNEVYELNEDGLWSIYGVNSNVRVKIPKGQSRNLVPGSLATVSISCEPLCNCDGELIFDGNLVQVIGYSHDPSAQIKAIGCKYGFEPEFSPRTLKEANKIPASVSSSDFNDRVDLTNECVFTIDGEDTKDMDDAVSISKCNDNYILKVHIADVSYYVPYDSALDRSALNRGNSLYLADSVIPMFPESMSNGICSLNEGVPRLTKTVEMIIDKSGNIVDSKVYRSVIKSRKKMSYEDVNILFETGKAPLGYEDYKDDLALMRSLSKIISAKRKSFGSLDFYSREYKISTDNEGNTTSLSLRNSGEAQRLIENFMIYANTTVANHFGYLGIPFVFRIHEAPCAKDLMECLNIIKNQGIVSDNPAFDNLVTCCQQVIAGNKECIKPEYLYPFLSSIKESDYYEAVSNLLLKCMTKAIYAPDNIGHFGLSEDAYCHFTSPIRRYADLLVHRMIDYMTLYYEDPFNKDICSKISLINDEIRSVCEHISTQEVLADKAEREVCELKSVQYFSDNISDYIGPIKGKILNINRLGMTVIVDDLFKVTVDASVLASRGYIYKNESHSFVNSKTSDSFKLGNEIYLFDPSVSTSLRTISYNDVCKDISSFNFGSDKKHVLRRGVNIKF